MTITAVVALLLLAASAAFACTVWKGKFIVTVTSTGPGEGGQVTGWGANATMEHCVTAPWEGQAFVHAGDATGSDAHPGGDVHVEVEPLTSSSDPCGSSTNLLSDGTYNINFLNTGFGDFVGVEPVREYVRDCMTGGHRSAFEIGEIKVSGGAGMGTFSIDKPTDHPSGQDEIADLPGTESAICVSGPTSSPNENAEGMQNPITVI